MALTKNASYDNPVYLAVLPVILNSGTGAVAVTSRFAAWTTMLVKSIQITPVLAGTSTNASFHIFKVSGTIAAGGTDTAVLSTTTTLLATFTALQSVAKNVLPGSAAWGTLTAGDVIWVAQSTDATIIYAASAEIVINPGASVTP